MLPVPEAATEAGLIGPAMIVVHENVVAPMLAVGTNVNVSPLQMVCAKLVEAFVMTGTGFTVTVTGNAGPGQP